VADLRWIILGALLAVGCFAPLLGDRWLRRIEALGARLARRKVWTVIAVALLAITSRLVLFLIMPLPVPACHDEFSYLLAADTFVHGRLANPPHSMWIFFDTFHVLQHPTYASMYPPAQGGVLALGQLLGHPWIGVLLSMALMCASMTWMLQGWLPPQWALLGGLLVLLRIHLFSYWLDSYWGGAVAAIGGALVIGAFPRIVKRQRPRDALLMGIGAGLLANSRPFEGLLFCVPVGIALTIWLLSDRSPEFRTTGPRVLLPLLCVTVLTLGFMGYYNRGVTGDAFLLPHVLDDRLHETLPPFVWQSYSPRVYANAQFDRFYNGWVVREYHQPFLRLCWDKFRGWWDFFLGSFLAIPLLALPWVLRDRRTRLPLVLFVWCWLGLLAVVYFFPHYAAPMAAAFFILLVQAMRHLRRWQVRGRPIGIFLTRLVVILAIIRVGAYAAEAYRHPLLDWSVYRARIVRQLEATPGKQLVIVRYAPDHIVHHEWVYNSADIDGSRVVWAREIPGKDMTPLLRYFHDRKVWIVEPDQVPPRREPYAGGSAEKSDPIEGHQ
jgi:hypothetical protein